MSRTLTRAALFAVAACLLAPLGAGAQIDPRDLIGSGPKAFVEPEGFYQVVLPPGFDCSAKVKRRVVCKGQRKNNALLQIDVLDVPKSATAKLHWLNQMDRFKKKPHFQEIEKEDFVIEGKGDTRLRGVKVAFRYDYMGNVQYKVGVVAAYIKQENKLYSVHFESRLNAFRQYKKDLEIFFETFKPMKLDPGGNPIVEDLDHKNGEIVDKKPNHIKNPLPIGY